jgi:hypothetical protein
MQSFSRTTLESRQRGKIWVRANFASLPLQNKEQNQKLLRAKID